MDFLKDKKNLPIVIGIAVAVVIMAGGLIALELGAFSSSTPTAVPIAVAQRGGPTPGGPGIYNNASPPPGSMGMPLGAPPPTLIVQRGPAGPGALPEAAPAPVVVVDPTRGPDPFSIPGGTKRIARADGAAGTGLKGMKAPLRDILPAFNLFKVQAPEPPPVPPLPVAGPTPGSAPPANIRFDGVVSAADGIYAILEVNGQSQTVKPGDSLQDGSRVMSIQATSVTLRSAAGVTSTVQMTGGAGQTDPNGNGQDNNGQGNGQDNGQFNNGQFGQP